MTDVTDLIANPIPSSDLEVLQRNAEDFDKGINGGNISFQNRAGNTLLSYERALQAIGAINNTGDWVTGTNYSSNDLWRHTGNGAHYLVLSAYTSGANEAADIALAPKVVEIWQGAPGIPADATTRPASVIQYGSWVKLVNATTWELTFFDGADDIVLMVINPVANTVVIAGAMPTIPSATEDNIATFDSSGNAKDSGLSSLKIVQTVGATGPSDAIIATFSPAIDALTDTLEVRVRASFANATTTPTVNYNGLGDKVIVKNGNQALSPGDIAGPGHELQLVSNTNNNNVELLNPSSASSLSLSTGNYMHVQDQQSAGVSAGNFASGDWRTRVLNTVENNTIAGASLLSNQITLPAGDYYISASAPGFRVAGHKLRVQNITDVSTIIDGTSMNANLSNNGSNLATASKTFTLADIKVIELQHRCQTSQNPGFGVASNVGATEVYANIEIWKVG